jgi:hypothetical protein
MTTIDPSQVVPAANDPFTVKHLRPVNLKDLGQDPFVIAFFAAGALALFAMIVGILVNIARRKPGGQGKNA